MKPEDLQAKKIRVPALYLPISDKACDIPVANGSELYAQMWQRFEETHPGRFRFVAGGLALLIEPYIGREQEVRYFGNWLTQLGYPFQWIE